MSEMMKWARQELILSGHDPDDNEDGPDKWLAEGTLKLLEVFCNEGHSGMSAPFAVNAFSRLAKWKPLSPLTGEDDEWNEVGHNTYQNRRFSAVFKEGKDGQAYWIEGLVFWEWHEDEELGRFKSYFTNRESRVPITFPFSVPDEPEYREAKADDR